MPMTYIITSAITGSPGSANCRKGRSSRTTVLRSSPASTSSGRRAGRRWAWGEAATGMAFHNPGQFHAMPVGSILALVGLLRLHRLVAIAADQVGVGLRPGVLAAGQAGEFRLAG